MLKQDMKRRKKSKYKYAVIGKKKYYFYKMYGLIRAETVGMQKHLK